MWQRGIKSAGVKQMVERFQDLQGLLVVWSRRPWAAVLSGALLCGMLGTTGLLAHAQRDVKVNWNGMGLTSQQSQEINRLENEWRDTYRRTQPLIERDRAELRRLVNDPNANESQVLLLQSRIHKNEELLRNEATRIFMKKKGQLSPTQKQLLQRMIGP